MATFFLIRHGDKTHEDVMIGRAPGVHLTPNGRRQAARLARFLRRTKIDRILSSPLERAIETATPLAKAHGREIEATDAFNEMDMGEWTGRPKTAVERTDTWKHFEKFHGGTSAPGGETLVEAQTRIASGIIRLREKHLRAAIAIFTHEDPIRLAICYFIGAPTDVFEHLTIRTGSITLLRLESDCAIVELMDVLPPGDPRIREI